MVQIIDRFIIGDIIPEDLNLSNFHFNDKIKENSLKKEDILNALLEKDPAGRSKAKNGRYEIYYACEDLNSKPMYKDHKYYKVIIDCDKLPIELITIIPTTDLFRDNKSKHKDGLVNKAYSKRKHLY